MKKKAIKITTDEYPINDFEKETKDVLKIRTFVFEKAITGYFDNFFEVVSDKKEKTFTNAMEFSY